MWGFIFNSRQPEAFSEYPNREKQRFAEMNDEFYSIGVIREENSQKLEWINHHVVTRSVAQGFHHKLCTDGRFRKFSKGYVYNTCEQNWLLNFSKILKLTSFYGG